ncbi:MAG: sigma 54-interacting transcriptional regulator [Myxococcaceae bacterium]
MTTGRQRGPLEDDDDVSSSRTDVNRDAVKPSDETLQVAPKSGYRLAPNVQGFRLTSSPDGNSHDVTTGVAAIGADPGNDLVLQDQTVSRFHCEVRLEDKRPVVRDLGSTNGTYLDGVRVKEGFLKAGSVMRLGRAEVKFELLEQTHFLPVSDATRFGELVGSSAGVRMAFRTLEKAARTDSTVILLGETGTGKTRAAQALHTLSARAAKPFLVVDCGALPPNLLESELFGHEKGAFTGATSRRLGVFEEAQGGTVLLDEIGELPLELQPKLLRVLEDRQIRRLGQNQYTKVDVRVVAATHRDLRADVNSGRFRQDLYFRLAVAKVALPPLRSHPEDIPEIARVLLQRLGALPANFPALHSTAFLDSLKSATWPGNVRELRNYLERCILFEEPAPLTISESPRDADYTGLSFSEGRRQALDAFEKSYVSGLVDRHAGKVAEAAVEADVDRVYLYRLMRKHGIKQK